MEHSIDKDIVLFEELASNAHVALNVMQYDGWLLKFSEGHTNRANSVSMIYPSTIDICEKIAYCEKIYSEQELPCVFKFTDGDDGPASILVKRGYKEFTPTDVMTKEIDDTAMPAGDIVFFDKPAEEWLRAYFAFEGFSETGRATYRRMLDKICIDAKYVAIKEHGEIIAVASSASERGYMLIQNVVVNPDFRRKGYGRALCKALISQGKKDGAKTAWLQVVQSNEAAYRLYESLGFRKVYSYRYMKQQ